MFIIRGEIWGRPLIHSRPLKTISSLFPPLKSISAPETVSKFRKHCKYFLYIYFSFSDARGKYEIEDFLVFSYVFHCHWITSIPGIGFEFLSSWIIIKQDFLALISSLTNVDKWNYNCYVLVKRIDICEWFRDFLNFFLKVCG